MANDRLSPFEARRILKSFGARNVDFHALPSSTVDGLLESADAFGYRRPRNANGSRARYFHAYLCRLAARKD